MEVFSLVLFLVRHGEEQEQTKSEECIQSSRGEEPEK